FNRDSDSVTVGALGLVNVATDSDGGFNRESDSVTVGAKGWVCMPSLAFPVSIAKAIPSLLERRCIGGQSPAIHGVSIAKAIPSLLERGSAGLRSGPRSPAPTVT